MQKGNKEDNFHWHQAQLLFVVSWLSSAAVAKWDSPVHHQSAAAKQPGGRLNKKDGLTRYGNSHVKDKTS